MCGVVRAVLCSCSAVHMHRVCARTCLCYLPRISAPTDRACVCVPGQKWTLTGVQCRIIEFHMRNSPYARVCVRMFLSPVGACRPFARRSRGTARMFAYAHIIKMLTTKVYG